MAPAIRGAPEQPGLSVVHNHATPNPGGHPRDHLSAAQARGTTTGNANRSIGLGLFIVPEIARAHAGDASVESSPEAGTPFRIAFPTTPPAAG